MTISGKGIFRNRQWYWMQRTCAFVLTIILLSACAQNRGYLYDTGERPIPPGIENQILPHKTTQDEVLTLMGEPIARLKTKTGNGHIHIWTYSYMDLQSPTQDKGESLTITFDDTSFVVLTVTRGPL